MFTNRLKDIVRKFQILHFRSKWKSCIGLQFDERMRVLILAPHPDDEVFGCGGLIAHLVAAGNAPHVVVLTGGGGSHRGHCSTTEAEIVAERRRLTREAMAKLGLPGAHLHELNFIDGSITAKNETEYAALKDLIEQLSPDAIFVPHKGEGWPDHLAVRQFGIELAGKSTAVYEYCVWMWYYYQRHLDWANASALRLTDGEYVQKLAAIHEYTSALAPCGKPWVGSLPPLFLKANSQNLELFFRMK